MPMVIRITPHTDEIIERIRQNKEIALTAAAHEAQEGIKGYMIGGYARPVYDTGTLYGDVQFDFKDENTVEVGSTKDYAPYLAAPPEPVQAEPIKKPPKVYLSDYCADLNKCPTLEQAEKALAAVAIEDREQLKRAKDMRTWAGIIGQKS